MWNWMHSNFSTQSWDNKDKIKFYNIIIWTYSCYMSILKKTHHVFLESNSNKPFHYLAMHQCGYNILCYLAASSMACRCTRWRIICQLIVYLSHQNWTLFQSACHCCQRKNVGGDVGLWNAIWGDSLNLLYATLVLLELLTSVENLEWSLR